MYKRVLYKALEGHLDRKLITVVTGMRRVGKTTAVKYLLEKVAHGNKAYIDFEKIEHRHIFMQSSYKEVQIELEIMGIDFILNGEKAFEVKETPTPSDYQTLEKRARQLELPDCALIGRYPPQGGFTDFIWGGVVG